jgi:hypothetical protein
MSATRARERVRAAIGFTVKSGWASAVLVAASSTSAEILDSRRIELSDPEIADARQPYHAGFGTARGAGRALLQLVASVERFGRKSVTTLIREHQKNHRICGAGIVVGSLIDPETIANAHIRIHALEGQLFRGVVERAAATTEVRCRIWREKDLYTFASQGLDRSEASLRRTLTTLGKGGEGPWRAEEKHAALAAWLVACGR